MFQQNKSGRRNFIKHSTIIASGIFIHLNNATTLFAGMGDTGAIDYYIVPNMHPASCGWLVNFSLERNYCANSYFAHMDRANEDPNYKFVLSEVNNIIAMLNFSPERFEELKKQIKEGRAEIVNGMFCELTPNLSGGEAIVRSGVNGIKWYNEILGIQPRYNWMIDIAGVNENLAQISSGLGFEAMIHCRMNVSQVPVYYSQSPDGTKMITISPGHYFNWQEVFLTKKPLTETELKKLMKKSKKQKHVAGLPRVVLSGSGDYSLPPTVKSYPTAFVTDWKKVNNTEVKFSLFSEYFDKIKPIIEKGNVRLPVVKKGWGFSWDGFWIENYKVKKLYREAEHALHAAETLAAISSIKSKYEYPSQDLYYAWVQLHLNTDRNSLWGAATGSVFEDKESWDVQDRFNWINNLCKNIRKDILQGSSINFITCFNPINWKLSSPQYLTLPAGMRLKKIIAQQIGDKVMFIPRFPAMSSTGLVLEKGDLIPAKETAVPAIIENKYYKIIFDKITGEITRLSLKSSGKNVIRSASNILYGEAAKCDKSPVAQGYFILPEDATKNEGTVYHAIDIRKNRMPVASTKGKKAFITYTRGPLAQVVNITTSLYKENDVVQTITIYNDHPRIDVDVRLNDLPDKSLSFTDFNFDNEIVTEQRGIPYGFTSEKVHELVSREEGIHPAVFWSAYQLNNNTTFAILDRALPGREVGKNNVSIMLYASSDVYMDLPGGWLSGNGKQQLQYSILAFDTNTLLSKQMPKMAWEYNSPALAEFSATGNAYPPFLSTSENIIIQSFQRVNDELEIRFVECYGVKGTAIITLQQKEGVARLTNFIGKGDEFIGEGPTYKIPVRPQQIVTLRIKTASTVVATKSITDWSLLVPESKRALLNYYDPTLVGRPHLDKE